MSITSCAATVSEKPAPEAKLARRAYDFYLCGREEMIRDVTLLVDEAFPGSRVYAEIFFSSSGT